MSRSAQRHLALRFGLAMVGWAGCAFLWLALLSFDPSDPPGVQAWPVPDPPHNWFGPVGAAVAHWLFYYLGVGAYALVAMLTWAVGALARGIRFSDPYLRFVGLLLICATASTAGAMLLPASDRFPMGGGGGIAGTALAYFFEHALHRIGTLVLLPAALVVGLILAADELALGLARWLGWIGRTSAPALARGGSAVSQAAAALAARSSTPSARLSGSGRNGEPTGAEAPPARTESPGQAAADEDGFRVAAPPVRPAAGSSGPSARSVVPASAERGTGTPAEGYRLPGLDLLDEPVELDRQAIELACREKAYVLEQTLAEFRIEAQVVAIETGPVITVFELRLAPGVKVSQIVSLSNDMARALRAPAVRVVAPLPGKNTIGIEVPNLDKERVRLKDLLRSAGAHVDNYAVPLFLGKDASGQPLISDLTRMPHLLIAGTTGSGKSVCIASIIMSILTTRTPHDVQLIMVDPKVVELANFKDIPHLMCPIVTEIQRAEAILDWAATKMDERYALLAEAGVKDIRAYNRLGYEGLIERLRPASEEEMQRVPVHLPYIVIIVDELADLMMTSAKEVEFYLCRLAQKSRAVGIHLIVSTQRPQANVVTGLIKSNLPCRIAFRVASRLDSRIVLDQNGGEVLMGQGDMLFLPPGSSKLVRAQGTFVSDDELRRVVQHCRQQAAPTFHPELVRTPGSATEGAGERDELFDQAVEIILEAGRGSVSLLQRRLTIGYGRASRLIDQMYEAGIVGEYKGSQARETLMTLDEWRALRARRDREQAAETSD